MRMSKYFKIYELVPKVYFERGEELNLWRHLSPELVHNIDLIREDWGRSLTANNYFWGGKSQYRGWRPQDCPIGAPKSAHKQGLAIDLVPHNLTLIPEFWLFCHDNAEKYGITEIEDKSLTPTWVHISWRIHNQKGVRIIK